MAPSIPPPPRRSSRLQHKYDEVCKRKAQATSPIRRRNEIEKNTRVENIKSVNKVPKKEAKAKAKAKKVAFTEKKRTAPSLSRRPSHVRGRDAVRGFETAGNSRRS